MAHVYLGEGTGEPRPPLREGSGHPNIPHTAGSIALSSQRDYRAEFRISGAKLAKVHDHETQW